MKALIIALVTVALMLTLSIANSYFVTSFADEMILVIEKTPVTTDLFDSDSMAGFFGLWEKKRDLIALSVNFDYINAVEQAALEMQYCGLSDGDSDYLDAKAQLISCLEVIRDVETFSFFNII